MARNGRSSKSYLDEGHWRAALAKGADVVLIQFGHNDQPGKGPERETDPATTYRANLSRYIDEARAADALPVIVTSLTRRNFDDGGKVVSDLFPYADAAKAVAAEAGVPLVDLHAASIDALNRLGPPSGGDVRRPQRGRDARPDAPLEGRQRRLRRPRRGRTAHGRSCTLGLHHPAARDAAGVTAAHLVPVPGAASGVVRLGRRCPRRRPGAPLPAPHRRMAQEHRHGARARRTDERLALDQAKAETDSTIDNGATTTQLRFLALVYSATRTERFRTAFEAGFDFLLAAQYPERRLAAVLPSPRRLLAPHHVQRRCDGARHGGAARRGRREGAVHVR